MTLGLEHDPLFTNISGGERVLRALSDLPLPESLLPLATATERPIGFRHRTLPLYAVQYPIERNDPDAAQLLFNFASFICGAAASIGGPLKRTPGSSDSPSIRRRLTPRMRSMCSF